MKIPDFKEPFGSLFSHLEPHQIKIKYHLPDKLNLSVKITPDGWFVVTSPDLPGLITQARSQEELIEMVNDAVLTYFDVPKREADIVYDELNIAGQTLSYKGELATRAA